MTQRLFYAALALTLSTPLAVSAQSVAESLTGLYNVNRTNVMASAELLDEELYAFRPTEEVRSMGELFGHIANAQYTFCAAAAGEQSPATENFEQTQTTKAQILEALEMGFGYCDEVHANMTDEAGAQAVNFFTGPNTAFGVLAFNAAHNFEHYGNLVTYMRLNGITPPSSMQ
jgi:uncharacterized damage-inducible protein DinB